jgi:purine nucleosidase
MSKHKVIYDTDPGVDDAMALVFQARHPDIELLGLTSVFGNATIETTTRNARFLAGRFAPGVPVAQGAAAPLKRAAPEPRSTHAPRTASSSTRCARIPAKSR